jgi:hypothetical protein
MAIPSKPHSGTIIYPGDDPIATARMKQIHVPDEIHVISLVPTPLGRPALRFPLPGPSLVPPKKFLDIGRTDWTETIVFWQK